MNRKFRYLIVFFMLIVAMTSVAVAADTNDTATQHQTDTLQDASLADTQQVTGVDDNACDNALDKLADSEDNQITDNTKKIDKNNRQSPDVKDDLSGDEVTEINITQANYKQYFTIMSKKAYMGSGITGTNNSLILNIQYLPDVNLLSLDENSVRFQNLSLTIDGKGYSKTNMGIKLSTNFKTCTIENFDISIDGSYTNNDYLTISGDSSYVIRNITMDVQKRDLTSYVFRVEGDALIENCDLRACLSECNINWDSWPYLPDCIGLYVPHKCEIRNNNIEILVTGNNGGEYYSNYAVFLGNNDTIFVNNTIRSTNATGYSYGVVVRSSNNIIFDNRIYIQSHTYTSGIHLEMATFTNNLVKGNYVNVTSSYGNAPWGNIAVAYGINLLDFKYTGAAFSTSGEHPHNNTFLENTIVGSAAQIYGVEMYGGYNNTFTDNNITLIGRTCMGIGVIGAYTLVNNNNIEVLGEHNLTEGTVDYLKAKTAGLYTYQTSQDIVFENNRIISLFGPGVIIEASSNATVKNNTIITEEHDYTVSIDGKTSRNNKVTGNLLEARNNRGDDSVNGRINNTVENNTCFIEPTITVTGTENIMQATTSPITINVTDEESNAIANKEIYVRIDNRNTQEELTTDTDGIATYQYTADTAGSHTITITSPEEGNYMEASITLDFNVIGPILLTPENFDTYVTGGLLNDNVSSGAYIDVSGRFDGERYAFNITKPVNIYSSNHDAFFSFYSTATSESGSELPQNSFVIATGGSGTNVTGIYFENTEILVLYASDVVLDDLTVYCTNGYGWGRGSTSIRNSNNVTVRNSYFNTKDDNGVSTVVFAASQNSIIENCTVIGSGFVGNLVYATTYNVEVTDGYGNNNITIRNNRIIARNLQPGIATCYSVCVIGDNITVENNYIENRNNFLIMTQYKDDAYVVEGDTGALVIRNNSFGTGKIDVKFDPCIIENNVFYGDITFVLTNNTVQNNNTVLNASENPYMNDEILRPKPYVINIDAPKTYMFDETVTVNVTVIDNQTGSAVNSGYLEVYVEGVLFENITINSNQTSFTYSNESLGNHRIRVWYNTLDGNVSFIQKNMTLEALPITGQLVLADMDTPHIGDNVTLTVTYTLSRDVDVDVDIIFMLPGHDITVKAVNKTASLNTTITNDYINVYMGIERSVTIRAESGNPNIVINRIYTKLGVQKAITEITITPDVANINQETTVVATINTPTNLTISKGTITFKDGDGNVIATGNVNRNQLSTKVTFSTAGNKTITATYSGTTYYAACEATQTITVEKIGTALAVNPISQATYGDTVLISGTLKDEGGNALSDTSLTVQLNDESIPVVTNANGAFACNVTVFNVGINNVTVRYDGNDIYRDANADATFTVNPKATRVIIDEIGVAYYLDNVNVTGKVITVDGAAVANVDVSVDVNGVILTGLTDKTGKFTVNIVADVLGTNNVSVAFAGNNNYSPSGNSTAFSVIFGDSLLTVDTIASVSYSNNVNITGRLTVSTGEAIGDADVDVTVNGVKSTVKTGADGRFTLTKLANVLGTNNVTLSFAGNSMYLGSTNSTTFAVVPMDTVIAINPIGSIETNTVVTISGTFMKANGNALSNSKVRVDINGVTTYVKTDGNGVYAMEYNATKSGKNTVTASYGGSANYNSYTTSITFTATGKENVIVTVDPIGDVETNSIVTISGTFKRACGNVLANSNVRLTINGVTYYAKTNSKGVYSYAYNVTKSGVNTVVAGYGGSANYNPYSTNVTFKATGKENVIVTVDPIGDVETNSIVTISGTFKRACGSVLANSNVRLTINGVTYYAKTNSKGVYTFAYNVTKSGVNTVVAGYGGSANYNPYSTNVTFKATGKENVIVTINPIANTQTNSIITISGTFKRASGSVIANSNVRLTINGVTYYAKTNSKGVYTFAYNVTKSGVNTVVAGYGGSANYNSYSTSTSFNATGKENVIVTVNPIGDVKKNTNVKISGTFERACGKVLANSKVKLTVNGVTTYVKTNSKGVYTYTCNATKSGVNTVVAGYGGSANYNSYTTTTKFNVV